MCAAEPGQEGPGLFKENKPTCITHICRVTLDTALQKENVKARAGCREAAR